RSSGRCTLGAAPRLAKLLGSALLLGSVHVAAQNAAAAAAPANAVERGRYLANAGNCVSCHTRPGGQPFAGGVPFETPFGTVYSTNITQDRASGIGQWTSADLKRAMQEGVNRDGDSLIPAFPYTSFTKVSDADIADIYAFLRTVPPVRYTPPDNGLMLR